MKSKASLILPIFIALLGYGCAVSNVRLFSTIESSTDSTYGYTAENPVTIKNADLGSSIESSCYFISRLRTKMGNSLEFIVRYSVGNPTYKKPFLPIRDRFTGELLCHGTGPILDLYILKPQNEKDTIRIYINPYLKGKIRIPMGLQFVKE
jgi:hypothetical protein